jgi:hypothetical protein
MASCIKDAVFYCGLIPLAPTEGSNQLFATKPHCFCTSHSSVRLFALISSSGWAEGLEGEEEKIEKSNKYLISSISRKHYIPSLVSLSLVLVIVGERMSGAESRERNLETVLLN